MQQTIKERIRALRMMLKSEAISAFIIPSTDPHLSEYVASYWKTREWISGFTGSAGTAVFTKDEAGLWTDGRYFLQADQQLAGTGVKLYKMGEPGVPTVEEFIASALPEGGTLGFDVSLPSKRELHWKKPLLLKMPRSTIPKILSEKYGQTVLRFLKSRLSHSAKNTQVKVQRANLHVSVRL